MVRQTHAGRQGEGNHAAGVSLVLTEREAKDLQHLRREQWPPSLRVAKQAITNSQTCLIQVKTNHDELDLDIINNTVSVQTIFENLEQDPSHGQRSTIWMSWCVGMERVSLLRSIRPLHLGCLTS